MGFLMIFYIFMKLIFLPKKQRLFICPRLCAGRQAGKQQQQKLSDEKKTKKKTNRHLNAEKMLRIYFDFFLKVADIVCAIIVRCRDFNGFSVNLQRPSLAGACTLVGRKMDKMQFYINLLRCPVALLLTWVRLPNQLKWVIFPSSLSTHKSHLIETFFLSHRVVIY